MLREPSAPCNNNNQSTAAPLKVERMISRNGSRLDRPYGSTGLCCRTSWRIFLQVPRWNAAIALVAVISCMGFVVQGDWVDPDTPLEALTTEPLNVKRPNYHFTKATDDDGKKKASAKTISPAPTESANPSEAPSSTPTAYPTYIPRTFELVFSDEFNQPGRDLRDGGDPRWTALDKNDYTNDALHYYSPNNAQIHNGHLVISSEAADTEIIGFDDEEMKKTRVTKHFRSAMVQSWNKFCFTGGIIEAEVQLPGKPNVGGLWPALWLLGNLARHTYVGSAEHMWPWSSIVCTNKARDAQKLNGCQRMAHYGMHNFLGRGAPEIDIFEAQPGGIKANTGPFLKTYVGQRKFFDADQAPTFLLSHFL